MGRSNYVCHNCFPRSIFGLSFYRLHSCFRSCIPDSNCYRFEVQLLSKENLQMYMYSSIMNKAKSRKYQRVHIFQVKSRVRTWQVRGIWSQQLEHKQVPKWGTEPGVRTGKRSLLACHTYITK